MGVVAGLDQLKFLSNSKFALCHGVFDVLHEGHLNYLEEAKKLAPILVVSITQDRFVNKGPGRPHFNESVRARMLASLACVDYVVINDEPKATNVIKALRPTFYVKGPDYKNKDTDLTRGIFEEEEAVNQTGGKLVFTDKPTQSSSELINKYFNRMNDEQNLAVAEIKKLGGIKLIEDLFLQISKLDVTVIGEPIVDTYVFCVPEGISSKSPTVSARFLNEENYAGGSLAVANHIADFVKYTHLFAPHGIESYYRDIKSTLIDKRVMYHDCVYADYITPRKTRFIDQDKTQRMFELTKIAPNIWKAHNNRKLTEDILRKAETTDATLICDFGHGLFENGFLSSLESLPSFKALNCQTNSSNFGFNPFTKHKSFEYLSIDVKEARVAFHDIHSDARELFSKIDAHKVSMTLGPNGAFYKEGKELHGTGPVVSQCPAFADKIVDAIGAGDAYYAITALLVKVGAPPAIIPFVGNIFAGLKTRIIGNKSSVSKATLMKALTAILR